MKLIIFLAFFGLSALCCSAQHVTEWGDTEKYTLVGKDRIYEKSRGARVMTRVIKFPKVRVRLISVSRPA